jgi:alcohol dehydrogenase class IV
MSSPRFDFLSPTRIAWGWGRRSEIGGHAARLGRRVFLLHGSRTLERSGVVEEAAERLQSAGVAVVRLGGTFGEPHVAEVDRLVAEARRHSPQVGDLVCAVGGGSALDAGKAVAGLAVCSQPASVREYLEGVGNGRTIDRPPLPILAVPTTAGTGAEATKNAVVAGREPSFKKSLRDDRLMPTVALVDPELTVSNPPQVTASSGMDAVCQLMESILSRKSQPMPRRLALGALPGLGEALRIAYRDPADRPAREKLAFAALQSGLALANSGLGLAHAAAAALGALLEVPHGLACAVMLPVALKFNAAERPSEMREIAEAFMGRGFSRAESAAAALIDAVRELNRDLGVPDRLGALGVVESAVPQLVQLSAGSSLDGNPRSVTPEELNDLYRSLI